MTLWQIVLLSLNHWLAISRTMSTSTSTLEGKTGLTDSQRTILTFVVTGLLAIVAYMATLEGDSRPPQYVYAILGGVAVVAGIARDFLGVRTAAVAVKSKAVDTHLTIDKKFGDLGKNDVPAEPIK